MVINLCGHHYAQSSNSHHPDSHLSTHSRHLTQFSHSPQLSLHNSLITNYIYIIETIAQPSDLCLEYRFCFLTLLLLRNAGELQVRLCVYLQYNNINHRALGPCPPPTPPLCCLASCCTFVTSKLAPRRPNTTSQDGVVAAGMPNAREKCPVSSCVESVLDVGGQLSPSAGLHLQLLPPWSLGGGLGAGSRLCCCLFTRGCVPDVIM